MRWRYAVLGALVVTGCAKAGKDAIGGRPDGGVHPLVDADFTPPPDSEPLPDAPPGKMTVTLGQTNNMTIAPGTSVACAATDGSSTRDNNWYRVFRLSDYGVTRAFSVQQVAFAVDLADSLAGQQPVQVKIGTYTGAVDATTLNASQITPVNAMTVQVPNADASAGTPPPVTAQMSGTVQPDQNLIIEVDVPDGAPQLDYFYMGVSAGGESHPSYISSTNCGITPSTLTSLGFPDNAVLLTVTGTY